MFGFIVMACHISISSMKLECDWNVKKTFPTEQACNVYENEYTLGKGEQVGICDEVDPGVKEGDKRPILTLKK